MSPRPPYFACLLKLLSRKGRSREDAEDLIQEAMLRLHVYKRSAAVINEEAFLRRAVCNLSIDQHRRDRLDLHPTVPLDTVIFDTEWASMNPNPEQIVETHQRLEKIADLLAAASTRTREIFIANRAGYTDAEIVDHMNISEITVRRHVTRALQIVADYRQNKREQGDVRDRMPRH